MRYDVFISYSSIDQKIAEGVCAYLEQQGIRCFVAYRDIPRGVVWATAIVEALEHSRMMVVLFSKNFNNSAQVEREIELASDMQLPILTFRLCNDAFRGAKKYYLQNLNWIDAFPDPKRKFGALHRNVASLLGIAVFGSGKGMKKVTLQFPETNKSNRFLWISVVCLSVALVVSLIFNNQDFFRYKTNAVQTELVENEQADSLSKDEVEAIFNKGRKEYYSNNYSEAVIWFEKAALQGHAKAQFNLGYCYKYARGISQNLQLAVYWFTEAAKQGNYHAQYNLGYCYEKEEGVSKKLSEALKWYEKSAEQGYEPAIKALERLKKK